MKINTIHRWVGLLICMPVLIMSLTGVALIWKKEFLWFAFPQARETLITDALGVSETIKKIEQSYALDEVLSIQIHAEDLALYKVILKNQNYAWHDQFGNTLQQWSSNQRWEDWLLDLHHRFLLSNSIGLNIAGVSGLLIIPLVIIGLVIWWPGRQSLKSGLWPKLKQRGSLLRSHSNIGACFSLSVLLISVTGVILVYPVESRQILVKPFGEVATPVIQVATPVIQEATPVIQEATPVIEAATSIPKVAALDSLKVAHDSDQASWLHIINRAHALYPQARLRWVWPATSASSKRTLGLQQSIGWNTLGQTYISVDSRTGELLRNHNALTQPRAERITNFTHPLHTGKLGLWYRLLLTGFGLALFLLALFGLSSFLKSFSKR